MKIKYYCFIVLFVMQTLWALPTPSVAVLTFDDVGIEETEAITLTDRFRSELIKSKVYSVMERGEMAAILEEQEFQQSGCVDQECAVELGQIIAVQKIVAGSVARIGNIYSVTVKLIDVETGSIEMSISEDCDCPIEKLLLSTMNRLAFRIAGLDVEESSTGLKITRGDAFLFVKSSPGDANIYIDGELIDRKTPAIIENMQPGPHAVLVQKDDLNAKKEVVLVSNKVARVDLALKRQETVVKIVTSPPEADVYWNDKRPRYKSSPSGVTPQLFTLKGDSIATFSLFKVGFADTTFSVAVEPNTLNTVTVALKAAQSETIKLQERLVIKRKQRKVGLSLDLSGVLLGVTGGILYLAGESDLEEAYHSKQILQSSTLKSSEAYNNLLHSNREKHDSGIAKQNAGITLLASGATLFTAGLILTF